MAGLQDTDVADQLIHDTDHANVGHDLTVCDREPIHIPGAIQPHGILLVADAHDLRVVGGAGDIEGRLAATWLGRRLVELLGATAVERLGEADVDEAALLGPVQGRTGMLDAVAHLREQRWLIQLEPQSSSWTDTAGLLGWLDRAGGTFERAADLRGLCDAAAVAFRELTGFDRVMIYRFLDDDTGVVLAESRDPSLDSFLNHHFPASDIPKQARALYIRNRVRVIPDVAYVPQPIQPVELRSLDLSDVDLRSVSPIHLQYLRNMGVAASASVSVVKDGVLWGLIACHGRSPRSLSFGQRLASQALASGFARQVRAKEEAEDYRERLRLRMSEDIVTSRLLNEPIEQVLAEAGNDLQRMLDADGFAVLQGKALQCVGRCPDTFDVREIANWVRTVGGAQVLHTHALSERFPAAEAYRDLASGLLAVVISSEEPLVLMWLRAERITVVNWAGNPHKPVDTVSGVLTPRASFEAWREEVHGQSRPWSLPEIDAVQRLMRALYEARQTRRIRDLNRDLAASVADKESLLLQKDYLIKEVNHRIQNSLQLVSAFLSMQARAEGNEALTHSLLEAQRRLSAVALVHRRLYSDDSVETIDLGRYFDDLIADMKSSMGSEWAEQISTDFAPLLIPTDAAVNIGLILTELVINANKYAYSGAPGPITISLEQHRARLRLIVADRGSGKTKSGVGFGTRMMNAMVERLGGMLEEANNKPGLRVIFTAPISQADTAPK